MGRRLKSLSFYALGQSCYSEPLAPSHLPHKHTFLSPSPTVFLSQPMSVRWRNGSAGYSATHNTTSSYLCLAIFVPTGKIFFPWVSSRWANVKRRWWSLGRNRERSRNEHSETYQRETTLKSFHTEVRSHRSYISWRVSFRAWARRSGNSTRCPSFFYI